MYIYVYTDLITIDNSFKFPEVCRIVYKTNETRREVKNLYVEKRKEAYVCKRKKTNLCNCGKKKLLTMNADPQAPNLPYWSNENRDLGICTQNIEQNNSEHMSTRNFYVCIYIYTYIVLDAYGTIDLLKTQFYYRKFQISILVNRQKKPGYGVATISRLLKIIGLFCRIPSLL